MSELTTLAAQAGMRCEWARIDAPVWVGNEDQLAAFAARVAESCAELAQNPEAAERIRAYWVGIVS